MMDGMSKGTFLYDPSGYAHDPAVAPHDRSEG